MLELLWKKFEELIKNSPYRKHLKLIAFFVVFVGAAILYALNSAVIFCSIDTLASYCKASNEAPAPAPAPTPAPTPASASDPAPAPKPKVMLIDSDKRKFVMTDMERRLQDNYDVLLRPQSQDWMAQFEKISKDYPDLVVVHFHSLRNFKITPQAAPIDDLKSESELLRGLREMSRANSNIVVLLYSSSFVDRDEIDSRCAVLYASLRALKEEGTQSKLDSYEPLLSRLVLLPWSDDMSTVQIGSLNQKVTESLKKPFIPKKYESKNTCDKRLKASQ